ncbi:hypothetical protein [Pseudescherichia vulneris]|uniref:hypothetical protein n=1 Tax=Pseudescherichia vulneris TaxID=566 RepID=UPI001EE139C7|nr:hypothetical protein [Pseudescherichia vulneris]
MKYFTIEQVVEDLKAGRTRRHNIYTNYAQAKSRGYTERAALFKEALDIYDTWKQEHTKNED